jgi:hypothetical protein
VTIAIRITPLKPICKKYRQWLPWAAEGSETVTDTVNRPAGKIQNISQFRNRTKKKMIYSVTGIIISRIRKILAIISKVVPKSPK